MEPTKAGSLCRISVARRLLHGKRQSLEAPGYDTVDLNVHYATEFSGGPVRSLMAYFEIRNARQDLHSLGKQHHGHGQRDASNTRECLRLDLSGAPRTYYAGMKVRF